MSEPKVTAPSTTPARTNTIAGGIFRRRATTDAAEMAMSKTMKTSTVVAMLGLLGLRIFEATGADIADLGEEHGHRVLRVCGKGTKIAVTVPYNLESAP